MANLRGVDDQWLQGPRTADWYTGKPPVPGVCPGVSADGRLRALPMPHLGRVTRKETQAYFDNCWTLTEALFAGFRGEEPFYRPPVHGLRHPQIFYYGHSPCLYINKFRVAGVLDGPVNAYLESIFEIGVDEMLWDDMHKNDMIWPLVSEVHAYRKQVYEAVSHLIATHPALEDGGGSSPVAVGWDHPMWSLFMGFEHERIHLETSSVLFRETPVHLMQVPAAWPALHPSAERPSAQPVEPREGAEFPRNELVPVQAASVQLGKPRGFPSYGWDNEYGHRVVEVPAFAASKQMVSNGEFWHFVNDGGYRTPRFWSEDGWNWRTFRNMKCPFFWERDGPTGSMRFRLRTIFEVKDMQWDWPVDVNYHEAKAYCAWRSEKDGLAGMPEAYRVVTEAEHHLLRDSSCRHERAREDPMADRAMWAGGDRAALPCDTASANLNLAYGSQSPVDSLPASSAGFNDTMGNAWEWTEDHFNPLEGFKVHFVYDDFSTPCFDGKHHMIMGGSFASSGDNGASIFCRYHFRPHFLQHSGFRLCSSSSPAPAARLGEAGAAAPEASEPGGEAPRPAEGYESSELLDQYLGFHFPASGGAEGAAPILPHAGAPEHALRFPQRAARLLLSLLPQASGRGAAGLRALDLGCAVGGSSFELAAGGLEVLGVDFSESFIDAAERMRRGEEMRFGLPMEGDLRQKLVCSHEPNVDAAARARTSFRVGDACRLREEASSLGLFDAALLANLLCRLPEPLACLDGLAAVIKPGGVVVLATPFSWLEQYTERSRWLGGTHDATTGEPLRSKDRLRAEMEARGFRKVAEEQMPFLIREHQRKYQYVVSEATAWIREGGYEE